MSGHVLEPAGRALSAEAAQDSQNAVADVEQYDDLGDVARIRQLLRELLTSSQLTESDRRRDRFQRAFHGMSIRG